MKLGNGVNVLFNKKKSDSVVVEVTVRVGSNDETDKIRGVSHFIEHMLFEGTKKRPSSKLITKEIDKRGGEVNAFTGNERTSFYVHILKKYYDVALDVLSDIIKNPLFSDEAFEKEKRIILEEIEMVYNQPRSDQWNLFQKALYRRINAKYPIIGYHDTIKNMNKRDLVNYYKKYYIGSNISVSVVGDVDIKKVSKYFEDVKEGKVKRKIVREPKQKTVRTLIDKRKITQSYFVLGYNTVPRKNKDSYAFDLLKVVFGGGFSSRLLDELRNKRGLAYNVGAHYEVGLDFGFFACFVGSDKKNLKIIKKIVLDVMSKPVSVNDLRDAKKYIEGNFILENEDSVKLADLTSYWHLIGGDWKSYLKKIKKVSLGEINRVMMGYFTSKYTLAIIEQQ